MLKDFLSELDCLAHCSGVLKHTLTPERWDGLIILPHPFRMLAIVAEDWVVSPMSSPAQDVMSNYTCLAKSEVASAANRVPHSTMSSVK